MLCVIRRSRVSLERKERFPWRRGGSSGDSIADLKPCCFRWMRYGVDAGGSSVHPENQLSHEERRRKSGEFRDQAPDVTPVLCIHFLDYPESHGFI